MLVTQTKPQARTIDLHEQCASPDCRVDRQSGIIRSVRILGPTSSNNRSYSPQAMKDAARLYEGCRVNLDHPDRETPRVTRSIRDFIGTLHNCRLVKGAVIGDLHLIKTHPHAPGIMEAAEKTPRYFGLSHNASGDMSRNGVVESIREVRSVDLVQHPATNSGIFESVQPQGKTTMSRTHLTEAIIHQQKKQLTKISGHLMEDAYSYRTRLKHVRHRLLEMDGMDALPVDEAPRPDERTAEERVRQIIAIVTDKSLSDADKVSQICKVVDADCDSSAGDATTSDDATMLGNAPLSESADDFTSICENGRSLQEQYELEAGTERLLKLLR